MFKALGLPMIHNSTLYSFLQNQILGFLYYHETIRVCGVTVGAFARRWGGDEFNSRPKLRHS